MMNPLKSKSKMPSLSRRIFDQQWDEVSKMLSTENEVSIGDSVTREVDEFLILHYAACFNPPLAAMQGISSRFPCSAFSADCNGRYALHLACKYGASPEVVRFLIRLNPSVAGVQDSFGKTPMHYVGESYGKYFSASLGHKGRSAAKVLERCMVHVVELLEEAAPESANIMDLEGRNAIEYALDSEAELSVIRAMQLACRDDWRKRKLQCGGKRHDELATELETISSSQMAVVGSTGTEDTDEQSSKEPTKKSHGSSFRYINLHRIIKSRRQEKKERFADVKCRRLPVAKSA